MDSSSSSHYLLCKKVAVLTKTIVHLNMKSEDEEEKRQAERVAHEAALAQIEAAAAAKLEALVLELDPKGTIQRYERVLSDLTERHTEEKEQAAKDLKAHAEAYANARTKNEAAYVQRLADLENEVSAAKAVLDSRASDLVRERVEIELDATRKVEASNKALEEARSQHSIDLRLEKDRFDTRLNENKVEYKEKLLELTKERDRSMENLRNELTSEKLEALSLLRIERESFQCAAEKREKELREDIERERSSRVSLEETVQVKNDLLVKAALDLQTSTEETKIAAQERDKAEKLAVVASSRTHVVEEEVKIVKEQLLHCKSLLAEEQTNVKNLSARLMEAEALLKSLQSSGSEAQTERERLNVKLSESLAQLSTAQETNTRLLNDRLKADEEAHAAQIRLQANADNAAKDAEGREIILRETITSLEEKERRGWIENELVIENLRSDVNRLRIELDTSLQDTIRAKSESESRIEAITIASSLRVENELSNLSLVLNTKHTDEIKRLESEWEKKVLETRSLLEAESSRAIQTWKDRVAQLEQELSSLKSQLDSSSSSRLLEEQSLRARVTSLESTLSTNVAEHREEKIRFVESLNALTVSLRRKEKSYDDLLKQSEEEKQLMRSSMEKEKSAILVKCKEEEDDWVEKFNSANAQLSSSLLRIDQVKEEGVVEAEKRVFECESQWKAKLEMSNETISRLELLINEMNSSSSTSLTKMKQEFATALLASEAKVSSLMTDISMIKAQNDKALKAAAAFVDERVSETRSLLLAEKAHSIEELITKHAEEMASASAAASRAQEAAISALRSSLEGDFKGILARTERELEEEANRLIQLEKETHLVHEKRSLDELRYSLELDHSRAMRKAETDNRTRELSSLDAQRSTLLYERSKAEEGFMKQISDAKDVAIMAAETAAKQISDIEKEMDKLRLDAASARKESRPEDVSRIERLVQLVKQKEEEVKFYKLELLNRETNFNKVFSGSGGGGSGGGGGGGLVISTTLSEGGGPLAVGSGPRAVTALQRVSSSSTSFSDATTSYLSSPRRPGSRTSTSVGVGGGVASGSNASGNDASAGNDASGEPSLQSPTSSRPPPLPVSLGLGPGGQPPSPTTARTTRRDPPSAPPPPQSLEHQQQHKKRNK